MQKKYDNDETEIDLIELLFALKRKLLLILAAALAGGIIAGAYTRLMVTPVYRSTATMLVISKETTLTSLADLQLGSQLTQDYSVLIKSRPVLEEVIDNLGIDMNYGTLKAAISINNPSGTRILEISVTNSDPELARDLVNELVDTGSVYIGDQMEVVPPKVIEEGETPGAPISPSLTRNVFMGAVVGLALAAGIVILISLMNDTIKSEEDVEKYLRIPTLGSIPDRKDYISNRSDKSNKKKKKRKRRKKSKWQNKK